MAELMKESETDIKINFLRLEEELPHNQNLIGKWMTYQQVYQTKYQFLELDHRIVVAEKTKYYTGKLSEDEKIYNNEVEIGKILINDEYPFALVKFLDKNFDKEQVFKSENGKFKILVPEWLKI